MMPPARGTRSAVAAAGDWRQCLPPGLRPHEAAPPAVRVLVSNETAGTVAIVDPATGAVEHTSPSASGPAG